MEELVPEIQSIRWPFGLVLAGLIGATAVEHGLTIVTRDVDDFGGIGAPILDPWRSQ